MKMFRLLFSLPTLLLITSAFAQTAFVTSRDVLSNNSASGINLRNSSSAATNVYGLYVRQYSYVTIGGSCASSTVIYPESQNLTAGSFVAPITINPGQSVAVGSNYLYNMIFQAIYYENIIIPSSPPGCALPGCTWGSDTTKYNWCIYLGALAPVSTSAGYTSTVPPSVELASSPGLYNYNLVTNFVNLGPISCNDQTMTCTVSTQQTQSFS